MKIISKFQDYYDHNRCHIICAEDLIYHRFTQDFSIDKSKARKLRKEILTYPQDSYFGGSDRYSEFIVIGFCGELYKVWRTLKAKAPIRKHSQHLPHDYNYHYGYVSKLEYRNNKQTKRKLKHLRPWERHRNNIKTNDTFETALKKLIAHYDKEEKKAWEETKKELEKFKPFEICQAPVFVLTFNEELIQLEANPKLQDLDFSKLFNANQAHQEIDMYLGKYVTHDDPDQITDDLVIAQQKGFDKWSFRQQGPKNKKRKQKHNT